MANVKITELTNLTDPSTADVMPVVDVDADVTKKVSVGEVVGKITGDVEVATDGTATISELPVSKLADGTARQLLQTDAAGTGVEWTNNVDVPGTLDVTGATTLDSTLGVNGQSTLASAAVSDLTEDRVVIAGASGELEDSANLTFDGSELGITGTLDVSSNATVGGDLTVVGDLTVEGTTTTLETQTVTVEDKNIELGVVDTPSDATADGGGLTLKGSTDKTINWVDATDAWTFSEHIDIASAKEFRIAGTKVLDATSLGSAVVSSSLTSVGTIATGTWEGDAIDAAYLDATVVTTSDTGTVTSTMILDGTIVNGDINASAAIADTKLDTISTAGKVSNSATTATDANTASAIVARDASGDFTAGTITADLTGNADTATKLDSSRTFAVTGDVTGTVSSDLTSGASIATSIASGVIVDDDVNAAAAIAGTKIDPDFGSQTVETTGDLAINTDVLFVDSSEGKVGLGTGSPQSLLHIAQDTGASAANPIELRIQNTRNNGDFSTTAGWGNISFYSSDTSGSGPKTHASIQAIAATNFGASSNLCFFTNENASDSLTERLRITNNGNVGIGTSPSSLLHLADAGDITVGTITGTKIGTATSQKIGFYNATPVVQPTTGVAEAAFVENSGGTAVNVDSTFGGYTIQQVVEALQTLGLLA